jgi:hypothetical protein
VLAAAAALSLALAGTIREGVFYTGDGGLKYAMTRQLARGELAPDLRLPAEPWVAELWNAGLYPFAPPFVVEIGGRRYAKDPLPFSALTAPLLAAFGWPGLHALPLLALWAAWLALLAGARRLGAGPLASALALGAAAFASPLTVYGAIYWEHTLAVALALGGLVLLLPRAGEAEPPAARRLAAGAALVALSAWFRSEHHALAAAVALAAVLRRPLRLALRPAPVLAGLAVPALALAAMNLALYGHALGAHGIQIAEPLGAAARVGNALSTAASLARLLAVYFPLALPGLALAIATLAARPAAAPERAGPRLLAFAALAYLVLVPAILPRPETGGDGGKQWGPRFLLVIVPLLCALAAGWAERRALRPSRLRTAAAVLFAAGLLAGVHRNAWLGTRELASDYAGRMRPLLELLRADPARVVAASEQFAPQEMISLSDDRRFFFVRSAEDLERLGAAALRSGQPRFLFLSDQTIQGEGPFRAGPDVLQLSVRPMGRYGWRLVAHEVRVSPLALTPPARPAAR